MTKPVTPERAAELRAAVAFIETKLREGAPPPFEGSGLERCRAVNRHAADILRRLRDERGAKVNIGGEEQAFGNGCVMSYLGVRSTCTSGPRGLLYNWITAARHKAALAERASTEARDA